MPLEKRKKSLNKLLVFSLIFIFTSLYLPAGTGIFNNYIENRQNSTIAEIQYSQANKLFEDDLFQKAAEKYKNASLLYAQNKNWRLYTQSLINQGKCLKNLKELNAAEKIFAKAESIALKYFKTDDVLFSSLYCAQSFLFNEKSLFDKSIEYANRSVSIHKKINIADTSLMLPYYALGMGYYAKGNYNESILNFTKSIFFASRCKKDNSSIISKCWSYIGTNLWMLGKYDRSLECYKKSALLIKKNIQDKIINTINIVILNIQLGKYSDAIQYLKSVDLILKNNPSVNKVFHGLSCNQKTIIYLKLHNYNNAITQGNNALSYFNSDTSYNKIYLPYLYYYLGTAYSGLNKTNEAIQNYQKCILLKQKYKQDKDVNSFLLLAKCFEKTEQTEKSDSTYNAIINYLHKNTNEPVLANVLLHYGTFCLNNNNLEKALSSYSRALDICINKYGFYNINTTAAYNDIANLWMNKCDYDKALQNYQLALASQIKGTDKNNIYNDISTKNISADIDLLITLKGKGKAFYKKYQSDTGNIKLLQASLNSYKLAIDAIDKFKFLYNNSESSAIMLENENETFDNAIEVASQLFSQTDSEKYFNQAFMYAEKSKSSTLLAAIRNNEAFTIGKVPVAFQKLEKKLQLQIEQYKQLLYEENKLAKTDSKKISYLNLNIAELTTYNNNLIHYLEKAYPEYYNLKYNTTAISADTITNKLKNNEAFIEYTLTDNKLISFIISGKNKKINIQAVDSSFTNKVDKYVQCINTPKVKDNSACREYATTAFSLYKILLKPYENIFKEKKLIIIPDEILYNTPFESLLYADAGNDIKGFNNLPYLIKRSSVSYAASGTLLFNSNKALSGTNNSLLAFAPTYENSLQENGETRNYAKTLTPLKGAVEEVNSISSIFKGQIFEGNNATINNFKNNSSNYGILHLAMHTKIDDVNPMYSKLAFEQESGNNGMLNTYELFGMQINSQLSVLSACNTGTGKIVKGEGMLCLAR